MGRPKVPPVAAGNPWQQYVIQARQAVATRRPQPTANLSEMQLSARYLSDGGRRSPERLRNEMLNDLFEHAQDSSGGGPGPHRIQGFVSDASPTAATTDATIFRTTPDEFLESQVYGPAYGLKRESMLESETLPADHPLGLRLPPEGLAGALSRRSFEIVAPSRSENYASPKSSFVVLGGRRTSGSSLNRARQHEWRHMAFPPEASPKTPFADIPEGGPAGLAAILGPGHQFPEGAAKHARYVGTGPELLANIGHMMGYEYGLTGKPILTAEDRIRAVRKWLDTKPKVNPKPTGYLDVFHGDPILEHGPNAGNPAEGYEFYRGMLQQVLPTLKDQQKKDVIKAMGPLGSTEKIKPEVANAV